MPDGQDAAAAASVGAQNQQKEITIGDVCRNRTVRILVLLSLLAIAALVIGLTVGLSSAAGDDGDDQDNGNDRLLTSWLEILN